MIDEFRKFLKSAGTNNELLSDELRSAIHIESDLEQPLRHAQSAGLTVVIAGTAGSGKSHLLSVAQQNSTYTVIPDLTDVLDSQSDLFTGTRIVVAANEGALLIGKKSSWHKYDQVVDTLHNLQKGITSEYQDIAVIDAAAYDPAGRNVLSKMLELPVVRELVASIPDEEVRQSWELLVCADGTARERLSALVSIASSHGQPFTFRMLWRFLADGLLSGFPGNEARLQPGITSIEALWNCPNEVSSRLKSLELESPIVLPQILGHFYYRDRVLLLTKLATFAHPYLNVLLAQHVRTEQTLILARRFFTLTLLESPIASMESIQLWKSIQRSDVGAIIGAINRYMSYDRVRNTTDLELWIQHDTERRQEKPEFQVSLGQESKTMFAIVRSQVFHAPTVAVEATDGDRYYLVHIDRGCRLQLDREFAGYLERPRSRRTSDRISTESDWRLLRFFNQLVPYSKPYIRTMHVREQHSPLNNWQLTAPIGIER